MSTTISVTPHTHWANGWVLRPFSRAVVVVDGTEHPGRWGRATVVDVAEGPHTVGVGARYRGSAPVLGIQESRVVVRAGEQLALRARNGLLNHQPFTVRAAP